MWGQIIAAVIGGLMGRGNAASSSSGTPVLAGSYLPSAQPSSMPPSVGSTVPGWLRDSISDVMPSVASALGDRALAGYRGRTASEYMDAAYPGTTPWEQLGSSAGNQALGYAEQADRQRQADRESQRQRQTSIDLNRMQAVAMLASAMAQNNGVAGIAAGERLLRESGVLNPAGAPFDYSSLGAGLTEARTGAELAGAGRSVAEADYISGPQTFESGARAQLVLDQSLNEMYRSGLIQSETELNQMRSVLEPLDRASQAMARSRPDLIRNPIAREAAVSGQAMAQAALTNFMLQVQNREASLAEAPTRLQIEQMYLGSLREQYGDDFADAVAEAAHSGVADSSEDHSAAPAGPVPGLSINFGGN